MLNKLKHFQSNRIVPPVYPAAGIHSAGDSIISLYAKLGNKIRLEPIVQGTLGLTFMCYGLSNEPCIVKTHLPGREYMTALKKEANLLQTAYGDTINVTLRAFAVNNKEQLCLQMDMLQKMKADDVTPALVTELINVYQGRLANIKKDQLYGIEEIWTAAWEELTVLHNEHFLTNETYAAAKEKLAFLRNEFPHLERCVCHGDLSDLNIMGNKAGRLIAIDWEDAFWGCAGYDYLYWLTFFNHRRFLQLDHKVSAHMPRECAVSILTMIVVVKCAISFYSGSYQRNSLSMEDRLREIWETYGRRHGQ